LTRAEGSKVSGAARERRLAEPSSVLLMKHRVARGAVCGMATVPSCRSG
jgi:hypothetical protein